MFNQYQADYSSVKNLRVMHSQIQRAHVRVVERTEAVFTHIIQIS